MRMQYWVFDTRSARIEGCKAFVWRPTEKGLANPTKGTGSSLKAIREKGRQGSSLFGRGFKEKSWQRRLLCSHEPLGEPILAKDPPLPRLGQIPLKGLQGKRE